MARPDLANIAIIRGPTPPTLAASRPLHACTAMKRPCFAGNGRAAAPARARGAVRRESHPPALAASRPLHARTARPRRARGQRSRRGSLPRLWVTSSRAPPPPDPASGEVRRESDPPALAASRPLHAGRRAVARRPHATAAPRLPPPPVGEGVPIDNAPPPVPVDCAVPGNIRCPDAPAFLR